MSHIILDPTYTTADGKPLRDGDEFWEACQFSARVSRRTVWEASRTRMRGAIPCNVGGWVYPQNAFSTESAAAQGVLDRMLREIETAKRRIISLEKSIKAFRAKMGLCRE
jgi:hypothetical protein